ncbi:MAG: glutathione peroxidase [Lachnospiraceae bacterium]|nr:glutathione peroxidase [Lachnospiraceae bacterium]
MSFYDYEAKDVTGTSVKMSEYEGKVVLVVNTATECGFTPQYDDLQDLYEKYQQEGFEILDFPCNQFGNQAPGTDEEIVSFCDSRYGITFPHFAKIDVNGENASPLYLYLQKEKGFAGFNPEHPLTALLDSMMERMNPDYKNDPSIKWNFTKFLIDRSGKVVARFEPTEDVAVIEESIKELL